MSWASCSAGSGKRVSSVKSGIPGLCEHDVDFDWRVALSSSWRGLGRVGGRGGLEDGLCLLS